MKVLLGGPIQSSHIHSVLWTDKGLVILFNDDSMYLYPTVREIEFRRLYGARSVGGYFYHNIKGKYPFRLLE
jgi:hypothetical protein